MTLQQAHERLDATDGGKLLGRREGAEEPGVAERVAPCPDLARHPRDGRHDLFGVGARKGHALVDEAEEVLPHPGNARELRPVRELVDGDPETELPRREAVAPFEGDDVRADVIDGIARGVAFLGTKQVVLAEHAGRHPAEDGAELDLTAYVRSYMARVEKDLGQPLEWAAVNHYDRPQQPPKRADVGVRPAPAVGHLGASRAGDGAKSGGGLDELLGDRGQLGEVVDESLA